jgi:hypothetical protein
VRAIRADFNNIYDDVYINVSVRRHPDITAAAHLDSGDVVELVDEAGESCLAWVAERRGVMLVCKIDWATWQSMSHEFSPIEGSLAVSGKFVTGAALPDAS